MIFKNVYELDDDAVTMILSQFLNSSYELAGTGAGLQKSRKLAKDFLTTKSVLIPQFHAKLKVCAPALFETTDGSGGRVSRRRRGGVGPPADKDGRAGEGANKEGGVPSVVQAGKPVGAAAAVGAVGAVGAAVTGAAEVPGPDAVEAGEGAVQEQKQEENSTGAAGAAGGAGGGGGMGGWKGTGRSRFSFLAFRHRMVVEMQETESMETVAHMGKGGKAGDASVGGELKGKGFVSQYQLQAPSGGSSSSSSSNSKSPRRARVLARAPSLRGGVWGFQAVGTGDEQKPGSHHVVLGILSKVGDDQYSTHPSVVTIDKEKLRGKAATKDKLKHAVVRVFSSYQTGE